MALLASVVAPTASLANPPVTGGLLCGTNTMPLHLPPMFQAGMVLSDRRPRVWGWGQPGIPVTITITTHGAGSPVVTTVTKVATNGRWVARLRLPPEPGHRAYDLTVQDGCTRVSVPNVLFGEVWMCSGQSNMMQTVAKSSTARQAESEIRHPVLRRNLRLFTSEDAWEKRWTPPRKDPVSAFSAVCYYFGRRLALALDKPVGLFLVAFGGAGISEFLPASLVPPADRSENSGAVHEALIVPLGPITLSGLVWYHGESDRTNYRRYPALARRLFDSWRARFGAPDLPIAIAQLANNGRRQVVRAGTAARTGYAGDTPWFMAHLRHAQALVDATDAHSWLVPAIDAATRREAASRVWHPRNKRLVGYRLARSILAHEFRVMPPTGPTWRLGAIRRRAGTLLVPVKLPRFEPRPRPRLRGFQLRHGRTGPRYHATAHLASYHRSTGLARFRVRTGKVPIPNEVRFEWADNPVVDFRTSRFHEPLPPLCARAGRGGWRLCRGAL